MVGETQMPLDCPNCHRIDSVQKITAIMSGGSFANSWPGHHSFTTRDSGAQEAKLRTAATLENRIFSAPYSQTPLLMKRLAPPPELKQEQQAGLTVIIFMVLSFLAMTSGILLCASKDVFSFLLNTLGIVFWGGGAWLIFRRYQLINDGYKNYAQVWIPKRYVAMARWSQLFYCYRCDGVFLPGKVFVPTDRMLDYLYSENSNLLK